MNQEQQTEAKYKALCEKCNDHYEAFLYDCDGTLADNMDAHKAAFGKVAASKGINLDTSIVDELAGWPTVEVVAEINNRYKTDFDPAGFAKEKSEAFLETIHETKPMDFVVMHLKNVAGKKKTAVVSGGRRETVTRTLKVLGIDQLIDVLVCAGDTEQGKPAPDPFLLAAKKLDVAPEKCMVLEDGEAGVQGAIAAGMGWVRVDKL